MGERRLISWQAVFVLAVWALMTLADVGFVVRYGRNCPAGDEWEIVPWSTGSNRVSLEWLFAQHNEHRIPLPRLLLLALDRFDFRLGAFLSVALLSASSLLLIRLAYRLRGQTFWADVLFPAALLNWGHWANLVSSWQLQYTVPLALFVSATSFVLVAPGRIGWIAICAALMLASGANGYLLGAPFVLWLLLRAVRRPTIVSVVAASCAVAAAAFLRPVGTPETYDLLARGPLYVGRNSHCGHRQPPYNSCRNRHCPKCQAAARAAWLDERRAELLPVPYFHVVFTLPALLAPLALQNKGVLYDVLFTCAAETLREIAAAPKYLGARIGFLAILHTWGQNLQHSTIPTSTASYQWRFVSGRGRWIACRQNFFLPVRVLSRVFRGKFLDRLRQVHGNGRLVFHGSLATFNDSRSFSNLLAQASRKEWVVYAKPPFGGPEQVLKYLARYTHRVAISNDRLLNLEAGRVSFRWKNYARGGCWQTMTLSAVEFIRRFL